MWYVNNISVHLLIVPTINELHENIAMYVLRIIVNLTNNFHVGLHIVKMIKEYILSSLIKIKKR